MYDGGNIIKYIRENEVDADIIVAPKVMLVKHLAAPWTLGTQNLWLGIAILEPGGSSKAHFHEDLEEVHYTISGKGKVVIDNETLEVEAGTCVLIPKKSTHQLFNTGNEKLKILAVTSPPFIPNR